MSDKLRYIVTLVCKGGHLFEWDKMIEPRRPSRCEHVLDPETTVKEICNQEFHKGVLIDASDSDFRVDI